ncbi:MAG: hypothetical protein L0Y57_02385 [Beijerinckiaceae bacterium]|nr:hypothetical protein [Beijerinckiaceae bacterium]
MPRFFGEAWRLALRETFLAPVRELERFCQFSGIERDTVHLPAIAKSVSSGNLRDKEERLGFG